MVRSFMFRAALYFFLLTLPLHREPLLVFAQTYPVWQSDETFVRDCVGRETEKLFVLTFDDGPAQPTAAILDILKEKDVPATFFVIGSIFDDFPAYRQRNVDLVRRTVQEGHIVANHGMTNNEFTLEEVKQCEEEVQKVTNGYMMQYFRPAQGMYTTHKHEKLVNLGYKMIMWNLDITDWRWDRSPDDVLALINSAVWNPTLPAPWSDSANGGLPRRGSYIMLAHDYKDLMLKPVSWGQPLLSALIDAVHAAGYEIVSLDECLMGPMSKDESSGDEDTISRMDAPTLRPTEMLPTLHPTKLPAPRLTEGPSPLPTKFPTRWPTKVPSFPLVDVSTNRPSSADIPTIVPSKQKSTTSPAFAPSYQPSVAGTEALKESTINEPNNVTTTNRTGENSQANFRMDSTATNVSNSDPANNTLGSGPEPKIGDTQAASAAYCISSSLWFAQMVPFLVASVSFMATY